MQGACDLLHCYLCSLLLYHAFPRISWHDFRKKLLNIKREFSLQLQPEVPIVIRITNYHKYYHKCTTSSFKVPVIFIRFQPFKAYWLRDAPTTLTFNNCRLCPHCIYVFCIYLRTNSDLCHLQHKLIGFYNLGEKCLLRGTDWFFN
jgi:hypothetical protein